MGGQKALKELFYPSDTMKKGWEISILPLEKHVCFSPLPPPKESMPSYNSLLLNVKQVLTGEPCK